MFDDDASTIRVMATYCGLTSITPELRNIIYAELFKVEAEAPLLESSPPSKALLLTCRKVY